MRKPMTLLFLSLVLVAGGVSQVALGVKEQDSTQRLLERKISRFEVVDALLRDGISELSLTNIEGLHLGFEEIIRDKIQDDPRTSTAHFSLHLEEPTLGQVLDALCQKDPRYIWSVDGSSINVYPRAAANEPSYLLDQRIQQIRLSGVPDPGQALTLLSRLFPDQQIGYFGGGDYSYAEPWTTVLERLTVRQFINRIAEHMGNNTVWVWQGGKDERMFTFFRHGFHTFRP